MSETVTVEFYGIPRQRAGCSEVSVSARTVAELLDAVEAACPGLGRLRRADGRLAPHYLLSLEGRAFLADPGQELPAGERFLLLSADAGG
jgi:molybdopterin converting factor small subunit